MKRPNRNWLAELPKTRCIAEFSLWSCNLMRIEEELDRIIGLADILHIDVADGVFAPSYLFFPDLVKGIKKKSDIPLHVHLMCDRRSLLSQIDQFALAGASLISIHVENGDILPDAFNKLTKLEISIGLAVCISTPIEAINPYIEVLDSLTLMGTEIGVKGQELDSSATRRLKKAKSMLLSRSAEHRCILAADGAIREHTIPDLYKSGADSVVMGSLAFNSPDLEKRIKWLRNLKIDV